MPLEEHVEYGSLVVDGSPEPVGHATHDHVQLVQMPPRTPTGFPVTQSQSKRLAEIDAPGADGFARHLNAPLEQQFLDVSIT